MDKRFFGNSIADFEEVMLVGIKDTLDFALNQYASLKSKGAPMDMLEKLAVRIKRYEDQIYELESAIANRNR